MKCDNAHGLFGGYVATTKCTHEAVWRVTIDEGEVHIPPMNMCRSCSEYVNRLMEKRFDLHGRITKVMMERIDVE
jgi:hypothetical protein